jgi:hypothetical protein
LRYTRIGNFFDRTPGALKGIPFCLDVTSDEYRGLWPHRYPPRVLAGEFPAWTNFWG